MAFSTHYTDTYSHCIALRGDDILLKEGGQMLALCDLQALAAAHPDAVPLTDSTFHLAALYLQPGTRTPAGYEALALRAFFASHTPSDTFAAARAKGIGTWRRAMQYCPRCGAPLADHNELDARVCTECKTLHFPKIEPCIIVVIRRGEEILLAKHKERNQDIYACIAGFVEDGETLEAAVRREIREEVGLEVQNIQYFGSQSWPFPYQLMIGFTCDYLSGDIRVQREELQEARWFRTDALPPHPRPGSISHQLIHAQIK